jgi:hypothetical protein
MADSILMKIELRANNQRKYLKYLRSFGATGFSRTPPTVSTNLLGGNTI